MKDEQQNSSRRGFLKTSSTLDIDYKCFYDQVKLNWSLGSDGIVSVSPETSTKAWNADFVETQDNLYDTKTKDYESEPGT